jgi:hypothetical protein
MGDIEVGLDIEPEKGAADSGDLESDLPNLFLAVAEATEERHIPVALLIDELQYFNQKELSALIMAMHKMQQRQLPLVLLGTGLPILPGLAGESKSYAERLFSFPDIGALSEADALGVTVNALGPVRSKLIKKGMIYSPAHGDMAFTVPLFDEFMLRAMPQLD